MTNAVAALPATGDVSQWSATEKALVEAAGLVNRGTLAPRPVVEAFLQHCRRTGLDPIARQIYCIERGGKWQTQVSIDGARLVAERTGGYEGQTPVQWTADGKEWVDVWLLDGPPAAARVGVYRKGFREPLYAVAKFSSYSTGQNLWKKMPEVMIAKCAKMLALREAFPMELSGLYSAEEMDQAGPGRSSAPREDAPAAVVQEPIAAPTMTHNWPVLIQRTSSYEALRSLWADAQGELGVVVAEADADATTEQFGLGALPRPVTVEALMRAARGALKDAEAGPSEDVVDAVVVPDEGAAEGWATAVIPGEEQAA
jgi:phage recombination protein Bet